MLRRLGSLLAATFLLSLVAGPAAAAPAFPDEIPLANGWQPEGIAVGRGTTAFVGSLADGGIARIDLRTGARDDDFVAGATGPAVGLEYEAGADRLWVAGGPSGEVRVYDATSGVLLATYMSPLEGVFLNDVVVTRDAAYVTDSSHDQLLVIPLGRNGQLPPPDAVSLLPLGGDWVQVAGFNANGIETFAGWLFVVNSTTGALYAVDPGTGAAHEILEAGTVLAGDGILFVGSKLYVVQNQLNLISIWSVHGGLVVPAGQITEDDIAGDLDVPATIAFAGGSLWAANARFTTPPTADTPYWITRVPLH